MSKETHKFLEEAIAAHIQSETDNTNSMVGNWVLCAASLHLDGDPRLTYYSYFCDNAAELHATIGLAHKIMKWLDDD